MSCVMRARQFHGLGHRLIKGMPQVFAAHPAAKKIRPEKFGEGRFDLGETAGIANRAGQRAERIVLEIEDPLWHLVDETTLAVRRERLNKTAMGHH